MEKTHEIRQRLHDLLTEALRPEALAVRDDSHLHAGHSGWRAEGGTHFHVEITALAFRGKSRLERQRMVNAAVAETFAGGVHALSISAKAPEG